MEPIFWVLIPITKLQIAIFCYKVQMFCKYMSTLVADSHQTHIPKSDIVLLLLVIKSDCNTNQYQNLQFSCHSVISCFLDELFWMRLGHNIHQNSTKTIFWFDFHRCSHGPSKIGHHFRKQSGSKIEVFKKWQ